MINAQIDVQGLLAETNVFGELPDPVRAMLAEGAVTQRYEKKRVLYVGEPGPLHVLASGSVQLSIIAPKDGTERVLDVLSPPVTFAEGAAFASPRPVTCTALEPTTVVKLDSDTLQRSPAALCALAKNLATRLADETELASAYAFLDLKGRLAMALLRLQDAQGGDTIRVSRVTLAKFVVAHRKHVTKALDKFEDRGLVKLRGKEITLLDIDGIKRRAEY